MSSNPEQLERIVAYLDGELSAEESAQVEQQLASDEQFRQQLQGAERAWMALDELPMATVGDDFSRTTMEMVVDAAREDVQAKTVLLPVQRRKNRTTSVLLAVMAALLGALMFRVVWNNPNRRLLADLPVIENVDIYSQFSGVQFLRELEQELGDTLQVSAEETEQLSAEIQQFQLVSATASREDWLESLADKDRATLRAKLNRFANLSAQKQRDLRNLHETLEAADDREQLLTTMFRFENWLSELKPSEQYKVREVPEDERAFLVAREMQQAVSLRGLQLSTEELQALFREVSPYVARVIDENKTAFKQYLSRRPTREKQNYRALPKAEQTRREFQFAMMQSHEGIRGLVDTVTNSLPPESRDAFERLPPREKVEQVRAWIQQLHLSGKGKRRSGEVTEQELSDFFVEDLDPEQQERLLALSREDMQNELRRLYFGRTSHLEWFGRPERGGPPRPFGAPGERPGRERFDERRGPGRGPGPGNGPPPRGDRRRPPEFDERREGRPNRPAPRRADRERPRRPRPPEERPVGEE